ncbi:MAG: DUF4921 family protein [Parcubacteria group bacterium]
MAGIFGSRKKTSVPSDGSEFRQDIVSGDWVLIATGRKKRPQELIVKKEKIVVPKDKCPFENPQASGNAEPVLIREDKRGNWRIQVVPNLYPAVFSGTEQTTAVLKNGPYYLMKGVGYHDVVITRGHDENFPRLSPAEATMCLEVMQERYRMVARDERIAYVSIFHNWGLAAGASVYHPHYQMISIPIVPPDVSHSLRGSERYYKENGSCVHCTILKKEKAEKKRIIFENRGAIAFLPFVSREPFEIRVFPKIHSPFFEDCGPSCLKYIAEALQKSLKMLEDRLGCVDYNFFIHTAPVKNREDYPFYHWHIEIQPKIVISAGFELGTGIEITVVDPDDGAAFLKGR